MYERGVAVEGGKPKAAADVGNGVLRERGLDGGFEELREDGVDEALWGVVE